MTLKIPKGIFHPGLFFSTHFLIDEIESLTLKGKKVLELGCGSGLISLAAASKGAIVTAADINPAAVSTTLLNASDNHLRVLAVVSDLFNNLNLEGFDYIIINPPYFRKNPNNHEERAWFAGKHLEYFQQLFPQLKNFIYENNLCLMVLSEDCDLDEIQRLAAINNLRMQLKREKVIYFEKNFIFKITAL